MERLPRTAERAWCKRHAIRERKCRSFIALDFSSLPCAACGAIAVAAGDVQRRVLRLGTHGASGHDVRRAASKSRRHALRSSAGVEDAASRASRPGACGTTAAGAAALSPHPLIEPYTMRGATGSARYARAPWKESRNAWNFLRNR